MTPRQWAIDSKSFETTMLATHPRRKDTSATAATTYTKNSRAGKQQYNGDLWLQARGQYGPKF